MSYQQNPYAPQDVYAQQQQLAAGQPYAQPGAYPPPAEVYTQPGAYPPPAQAYTQPGAYPPPPQYAQPGAYPPAQPGMYPPAQPYGAPAYAQVGVKVRNPYVNGALYNGIISIVLSLLTLLSQLGWAGLITGTFAIVRGIQGLNYSKQLPGNAGRAQAIAAIVMGVLAWVFVILSFILRAGSNGS